VKRLLLFTDLLFFLSSSLAVYFYFFVPPVKDDTVRMEVVIVFLVSIFAAIASGTTLLLYSPHLIFRKKTRSSMTKNFVWKEVMAVSIRRGVLLASGITGWLTLNFLSQDSLTNTIILASIVILIEVYFSQK
jgi:hypothetical protein